jgi:glyoxylase-like metal-dependent hydrolase (beta-lactamase superfamily II)
VGGPVARERTKADGGFPRTFKGKTPTPCHKSHGRRIDGVGAARTVRSMSDQSEWLQRVIPIRGAFGLCHVLIEPDRRGAILIDTGFVGERGQIRRALARFGLEPRDVRAILLTHGHLDHVGNLAWAKAETGAPIHAHPAEQAHIDGNFPYAGVARVCGWLERAGRVLLQTGAPAAIDVPIADGDELPFWGGLRVVHLPGHTHGHCGFFSTRHRVLFCGDLLIGFQSTATLPPPIFNSAQKLMAASVEKVRRLGAEFIVPQHYFTFDPARHRRRFDRLLARIDRRRAERARDIV